MKKFRFSMETVLHYREQLLDALRIEHAAALARVREQEEYRRRKCEGMTIADAFGFDVMLRAQEREIQKAQQVLDNYRKDEEAKRNEVIAAKTDKATIEKLKEKKLELYRKSVQKSEEQFIDEFVSTARVMAKASSY